MNDVAALLAQLQANSQRLQAAHPSTINPPTLEGSSPSQSPLMTFQNLLGSSPVLPAQTAPLKTSGTFVIKPPPQPQELRIVLTGKQPDLSKAKSQVPEFEARLPMAATQIVQFTGGILQDFINQCEPYTLIELGEMLINEDLKITKPLHLRGHGTVLRGIGVFDTIAISCDEAILESLTIEQIPTKTGGAVAVASGYTKMINCLVSSSTLSAVVAYGTGKVDVESCELFGSYNPCLYAAENGVIRCISSIIRDSQTYGVMVEQDATIYVIGSHIYGHANSGVAAQADGNIFISSCEIFKNGNSGLQLSATGFLYIDNTKIYEHSVGCGLVAQGEIGVYITKCSFQKNSKNAMKATDNSAIRSVENSFEDSEQNVLVLSVKNALISSEGDFFTGKTKAALACFDHGSITANSIRIENLGGLGGTCYNHGNLTVINSLIQSTGQFGFQLHNNANIKFDNVTVIKCSLSALSLRGVVTGDFINCKFNENSCFGLESHPSSGYQFTQCEFNGNQNGGLGFQGQIEVKFTHCTFSENSRSGIEVQGEGCSPSFENCQFIHNQSAFRADNLSSPQIVGGTIEESTQYGIYLSNSTIHVSQATISRNQNTGILISNQGTGVFESCTIQENGMFGVQVLEKGKAKFLQCLFANHIRNIAASASFEGKLRCKLCKFQASKAYHCDMRENGIISLRDSELLQTTDGVGIHVVDGGFLKLKGTHIHHELKYAILVEDKGVCQASGAAFYVCGEAGIMIKGSGKADFDTCLFLRNGRAGVIAEGGIVTLMGCTVKDHPEFGLIRQDAGFLIESNTIFENNTKGNIFGQ